jgi:hypothetical protein
MPDNKVLFILFSIFIISCKKNDDSALNNLAKEVSHYTVSYVEKGSAIRLNGITYKDTTLYYKGVAVNLSGTTNQETVVSAVIDTSLIQGYNTLYSESNPTFDTTAFKISNNGEFRIKANESSSSDSLYVLLKSATSLKDSAVYLIPVRLTTNNGAKLTTTVIFFKMFIATSSMSAYINGGSAFNYNYPYTRYGSLCFYYSFQRDENNHVVGPDSVKLSAFLGTPFFKDLNVYGALDVSDSLINAYNTTTGYNYVAFPEGTYELSKNVAQIPATKYFTKDSLTVKITHYDQFIPGTYYVLGIKLVSSPTDIYSIPPMKSSYSYAYISMYIN